MPDDWITVADAVRMTGLSRPTIQDYARTGQLQAKKSCKGRLPIWLISRTAATSLAAKLRRQRKLKAQYPVTAQMVAAEFGCDRYWLATLFARGKIKGRKIGGWWHTTREAVEKYKGTRRPGRPPTLQPPIETYRREHTIACGQCLCAICAFLDECPTYRRRVAKNRCHDRRYCSTKTGEARCGNAKTPLEAPPRLVRVHDLGWVRKDEDLDTTGKTICKHFVRDCDWHSLEPMRWSAVASAARFAGAKQAARWARARKSL